MPWCPARSVISKPGYTLECTGKPYELTDLTWLYTNSTQGIRKTNSQGKPGGLQSKIKWWLRYQETENTKTWACSSRAEQTSIKSLRSIPELLKEKKKSIHKTFRKYLGINLIQVPSLHTNWKPQNMSTGKKWKASTCQDWSTSCRQAAVLSTRSTDSIQSLFKTKQNSSWLFL